MAHIHEESPTYYLDQLCLIALSAAFGAVCLLLYLNWQPNMLVLILGSQFHLWVLGSGIMLLGMAAIRGVILWQSVGKNRNGGAHNHDHDHGHAHMHDHDHDREHCGHTHEHHHEGPCPEHGHEHAPGHAHSHAHDHADHDHDWAPWRYVLLLVPIMLFLLGLPNKLPKAEAVAANVDLSHEPIAYATLVATPGEPVTQAAMAFSLTGESSEPPAPMSFKGLEKASESRDDREYWKGKRAKIKGQFAPSPSNAQVFSLVRFRIRCCAADAVQLNVPMSCKESVRDIPPDQWVEVTGRVDFQKSRNGYQTVLRVPNRKAIKLMTAPDANPWDDPN